VITPLFEGHEISNETKQSIKRNDSTSYTWISFTGLGKHAFNVQRGLEEYITLSEKYPKKYIIPEYMMILDRDIILGRYYIDRMLECIKGTPDNIGFVYSPFEYKGYINIKFPVINYDINRLMMGNYISSNSLYKLKMVRDVGGFITDEKYHRLSDWAFFLKAYKNGYVGKSCANAFFTAISTENDISAGSKEEYNKTRVEVYKDFIKPLI
jgi:hypothetical protein